MKLRRRCVVCGRHVRRSDWRASRVLVGGVIEPTWTGSFANWVRPGVAHRGCVVVSDAGLERWIRSPR